MESVCEECKHRKEPDNRNPFSQRHRNKVAGLEADLKRAEREAQRMRREQQTVHQRADFLWKPHSYFWCDAMTPCGRGFMALLSAHISDREPEQAQQLRTEAGERATQLKQVMAKAVAGDRAAKRELKRAGFYDDVHGEVIKLYAICNAVNADEQCPLFEQRSITDEEEAQ